MAKKEDKKSKPEEKKQLSMDELIGRLRKELNDEFDTDICTSGLDVVNNNLQTVNWCPSLDAALGGGVLEGTWISVSGPPKLGKTASLMKLAVKMQQVGKPVFFLSPEGRLKPKDLNQVKGLDLSPNKFIHIHSTIDRILTTQDYLRDAERILKTVPGCFIIIDSVSALADEKELEGGIGTQTRGHNYQVISQFINNVAQLVPVTKSIVAGVIHKIANTSGMGAASTEKACNRWKYQADIQLEVKYIDKWKGTGEAIIGQVLHWHCKSSSLGRPFIDVDSYLRYGVGIDDVFETMKFAEACGLITKTGAWYELSFLEHHKGLQEGYLADRPSGKIQGGEAVWEYLNSKEDILAALQKEVAMFSNSLVKSSGD